MSARCWPILAVALIALAGDWPHKGLDNARSRATPETVGTTWTERWTYATGGTVNASPAVGAGVLVVADGSGRVHGLAPRDGTVLWTADTSGPIDASPALARGRAVVGNGSFNVVTFDESTGTQLLVIPAGGTLLSSPLVDGSTVYVGAGLPANGVVAVDILTGAAAWPSLGAPGEPVLSSPVKAGGTVYVVATDGRVHALDAATGAEQPGGWPLALGVTVTVSSPTLSGNYLYVASADAAGARLHRVHTDPTQWGTNWTTANLTDPAPPAGSILGVQRSIGSPVLNGTRIYVQVHFDYTVDTNGDFWEDTFVTNEYLVARNAADGTAAGAPWPMALGTLSGPTINTFPQGRFSPAPIVAPTPLGTALVVASCASSTVRLVRLSDGSTMESEPLDGTSLASPVVANGWIYFVTLRGTVYAFTHDANAPPEPPVAFAPGGGAPATSPTPTISWQAASDPDDAAATLSYYLRSDDDGEVIEDWDVEWAGAAGITQTTLPAQPGGVTVTYAVRTVDAKQAWSNWSMPQTFVVPVVFPPSNLAAAPGDGQVALTWTASVSAGVDTYVVNAQPAGSPNGPDIEVGNVTGATILVPNGVLYSFRVRTRTTTPADSPAVEVLAAATGTAPAPPTNLVATPGDGQVALAWTASASGDVVGYEVTVTPPGSVTAVGNVTTKTVMGLTNGMAYGFAVRAVDADGLMSGPVEAVATPSPPAGSGPPLPPTNLVAVTGNGTVTLSWTASASADAVGYVLVQTPPGSMSVLGLVSGATVGGLTNGQTYTFELRARDSEGLESQSVSVTANPVLPVTLNGVAAASVEAAVEAAAPGDVVALSAGTTLVGSPLSVGEGVRLVGASPHETVLLGVGTTILAAAGNGQPARVERLTVRGGDVGIDAGGWALTIENVVVWEAGIGVRSPVGSTVLVKNATLVGNDEAGADVETNVFTMRNTTVTGNGVGVRVAEDVAAPSLTYNDVYANVDADYEGATAGAGSISAAATFTNEAGGDYRDVEGSPTVDAGDPADAYALEPEPNGDRVNIGAYGNTPWAAKAAGLAPPTNFTATPGNGKVTLSWTASPSPDIAGYVLTTNPGGTASLGNVTTIEMAGLQNGTLYTFALKARDVAGRESAAVTASARPSAPVTVNGVAYPTLETALAVAGPGDTVALTASIYVLDGVGLLTAGVRLEGVSPHGTRIRGTGAGAVVRAAAGSPRTIVRMLSVTAGDVGIEAQGPLTIENVVVYGVSTGIEAQPGSDVSAKNVTVIDNAGTGVRVTGGRIEMRNATVARNRVGVELAGGSVSLSYNDAYGNAEGDYAGIAAGAGSISAAVSFLDEAAADYRDRDDAPTVDAGDPRDAYDQEPSPNGNRVNIGAYGNTAWAAKKTAVPPAGTGGGGGSGGGGGGGGCVAPVGVDVGLLGLLLALALAGMMNGRAHGQDRRTL